MILLPKKWFDDVRSLSSVVVRDLGEEVMSGRKRYCGRNVFR